LTEKFIIGLVGAPFGVKGFVKIRSLSGEIDHLLKLQSVIINKDGKEKRLNIKESVPANAASTVLMRFEGIDSPEAAKTLNSAQLLAGRDEAAPLGDGEFYIEDLKGLEVFAKVSRQGEEDAGKNKDEEKELSLTFSSPRDLRVSASPREKFEIIGVITDIIEGGGGELVEIKLISPSDGGEKRLVPFRKEFFTEISMEKGRVLMQNLWILD